MGERRRTLNQGERGNLTGCAEREGRGDRKKNRKFGFVLFSEDSFDYLSEKHKQQLGRSANLNEITQEQLVGTVFSCLARRKGLKKKGPI